MIGTINQRLRDPALRRHGLQTLPRSGSSKVIFAVNFFSNVFCGTRE